MFLITEFWGPGENCNFNVTVDIPVATTPATYLNTTSLISATTLSGLQDGDAATANLVVDAVLPLELLSFIGRQNGSTNILEWTTIREENTSHFIVERSKNGFDFEAIGSLDAAANSDVFLKYTLTDQQPYEGINYYRLKMVDLDKTFTFSQIITLTPETIFDGELKIVPIPTKGIANISFNCPYQELSQINVLDISGRIVLKQNIEMQPSMNIIEIDLTNLPPGVYFVKIDNPHFSTPVKILKE